MANKVDNRASLPGLGLFVPIRSETDQKIEQAAGSLKPVASRPRFPIPEESPSPTDSNIDFRVGQVAGQLKKVRSRPASERFSSSPFGSASPLFAHDLSEIPIPEIDPAKEELDQILEICCTEERIFPEESLVYSRDDVGARLYEFAALIDPLDKSEKQYSTPLRDSKEKSLEKFYKNYSGMPYIAEHELIRSLLELKPKEIPIPFGFTYKEILTVLLLLGFENMENPTAEDLNRLCKDLPLKWVAYLFREEGVGFCSAVDIAIMIAVVKHKRGIVEKGWVKCFDGEVIDSGAISRTLEKKQEGTERKE